jgi:hypothetical protein
MGEQEEDYVKSNANDLKSKKFIVRSEMIKLKTFVICVGINQEERLEALRKEPSFHLALQRPLH